MPREIHQVDAFSSAPFRGNPAAVVPLDGPVDAAWMQSVALEMNLSETAFVTPDERGGFGIRWFTPRREVPLCGHATLASAHVLWETKRARAGDGIVFHSASGELRAARDGDGITLDFPAQQTTEGDPPQSVRQALDGVAWMDARRVSKSLGEENWLLRLPSEEDVRQLSPDLGPLRAPGSPGVIVTAEGAAHDFVSRYFVPWAGIDEDPVTGSAHCVLTPYWAERTGRRDFRAFQASERGGELRCRLEGDRVLITGRAVTTLRGELLC